MKKIFSLFVLLILSFVVSGCTSYITAKYDDFNEVFQGYAYYDPGYGRASISLTSEENGTLCTGSTPFYQGISVYNFNLICSDGRMITGSMNHGMYSGKAFTNRNEMLSFTITKKKDVFNDNLNKYKNNVKEKPQLDNTKEQIKVIIQPNKF